MSIKVLIVDDDAIILMLHKELSKRILCANAVGFLNGKKALDYLVAHYEKEGQDDESVFLVLLDINMPEMNGWGFLDAIQHYPWAKHIYVVMVTSSIDNNDREKAQQYQQVIDFIEKPLSINTCTLVKQLPSLASLW